MMRNTIQQVSITKQGSRMDVFALQGFGYAGKIFVHDLLREYGEVHDCSYSVHFNALDLHDKKILLSYVVEAFEYEEAISCPTKLEAYFKEYSKLIQRLLDENGDEAYRDMMEEARNYYGE